MIIFYYFLTDNNNDKIIYPTTDFIGNIGNTVTISNKSYTITDYATEYTAI